MHTKLNDWKNGWYGIELSLKKEEIDRLISRLQMLKEEPDQHFHLTSECKGPGGVGDIEISIQASDQAGNMTIMSKALAPGSTIPDPKRTPPTTAGSSAPNRT
ncbi:MAG TPA: hypothetical protein VHD32_04280 [Candidatus Didemnitutus sp.]|nr:hypothetical protein [Candidatus Didemnitutus sp.]